MEVANNAPNTQPADNTAGPVNPLTGAGLPVNQQANEGQPAEKANPLTKTPPAEKVAEPAAPKPNQQQVFGKSELLDSGKILTDALGLLPGQVVGDLGAGGGMFTMQAARLVGEQGQVYAVDIIRNTLSDIDSRARLANLYNIKTVWSNLEIVGATNIPEASLDYALLVNVLFQSEKHQEMLTEAHRLLKPGGKLLVIDWSDTAPGFTPDSSRQVDPEKIINAARGVNFTLENQFQPGQYHFGLLFVKQ